MKNIMENRCKLIVLYGLPGSGKTALCKEVIKEIDNIKYINIGESADFNVISNLDIIKNNFDHNSNIITEGVFKSSAFRYKLIDKFKSTHDVICIYINESLENLSILALNGLNSLYLRTFPDRIVLTTFFLFM